jgi:hypothetical protein
LAQALSISDCISAPERSVHLFKIPPVDCGRLCFLPFATSSHESEKGSGTPAGAFYCCRIRRCGCGRPAFARDFTSFSRLARPFAFRRPTTALSSGPSISSIPKVRPGPGLLGFGAFKAVEFPPPAPLPSSSDAPRTPVVMPANMMPGPPGSRSYPPARRHRTRSTSRNTFAKGVPRRASVRYVFISVTNVNRSVTGSGRAFPPSAFPCCNRPVA